MSLDQVLADIRACRACLGQLPHTPRPVVRVFPETRLLICGQAPGRRVHESGRPFTDPSGDRLRTWMGVDAQTFYGDRRIGVAAMAFCFPGTDPKGGDFPPPARCAMPARRSAPTATAFSSNSASPARRWRACIATASSGHRQYQQHAARALP